MAQMSLGYEPRTQVSSLLLNVFARGFGRGFDIERRDRSGEEDSHAYVSGRTTQAQNLRWCAACVPQRVSLHGESTTSVRVEDRVWLFIK